MQFKDIWHFPRADLARRLMASINSGIVHSYVIFAPRRIGKTEFLLSDLKPIVLDNDYEVIYFNFHADVPTKNVSALFLKELKYAASSKNKILENINITQIDLPWCKINLNEQSLESLDVNQLMCLLVAKLEKKGKKLLLLLDEIQELVFRPKDKWLIGSLRTTLDINKQNVKVIFTGSSRAGLRAMFNDSYAPFFHFGANIEFEYFTQEFTDFLADKYSEITQRKIDKDELYDIFLKLNQITLSIREIVNLIILNPKWTLQEAFKYYQNELSGSEQYLDKWQKLSTNEKIVLLALAGNIQGFYSHEFEEFCNKYKITITKGQLQHSVKKLLQQLDIVHSVENKYDINEEVSFKQWVLDNVITSFCIANASDHITVTLSNVRQKAIYTSKSNNLSRDILNDNFNELTSLDQNQFTEEMSPTDTVVFIKPDDKISNFYTEIMQKQSEWF